MNIVTISRVGVIKAANIMIKIIAGLHLFIKIEGEMIPNFVKRKKKTGISKATPKPAKTHNRNPIYLLIDIKGIIVSI